MIFHFYNVVHRINLLRTTLRAASTSAVLALTRQLHRSRTTKAGVVCIDTVVLLLTVDARDQVKLTTCSTAGGVVVSLVPVPARTLSGTAAGRGGAVDFTT